MDKRVIEWLLGGDTGISSKTIVGVMTGCACNWTDIPYDPSDFGRCYRLLKLIPEWRGRMREMGERYPKWGPMAEAWEELTALYEEELQRADGRAPKLYERMRTLEKEGWKREKGSTN